MVRSVIYRSIETHRDTFEEIFISPGPGVDEEDGVRWISIHYTERVDNSLFLGTSRVNPGSILMTCKCETDQ